MVTRLRGNETIFIRGLRKLNIRDKTSPPNMKVDKPPVTLTPDKTWVRKNKERALINVLLAKDFMY